MAYREENLTFEEALNRLNDSENSQTLAWTISGFPIFLAKELPENLIIEATFIVRKPDIPCRLACLYKYSSYGGVCVLGDFSGPEELKKKYPELSELKGTLLIP